MADVKIPHFCLPFHYEAGRIDVSEQDSLEDIRDCSEAALRTQVGFREEAPNFGVDDPTFETLPIDVGQIVNQVILSEPRASMLIDIDQSINPLDNMVLELLEVIKQAGGGVVQ